MAKIVSSWNDWDPLKRVIVGVAGDFTDDPARGARRLEKVPTPEMRGRKPRLMANEPSAATKNFGHREDPPRSWRGRAARRPGNPRHPGTPDFRNDRDDLHAAHDILLTNGNETPKRPHNSFAAAEALFTGRSQRRSIDRTGLDQASRPRSRRLQAHNYYDEKITLEDRSGPHGQQGLRQYRGRAGTPPTMRMGKDPFIQHDGLTTNRTAADVPALRPSFAVHRRELPATLTRSSIDATKAAARPDHQQPHGHRPTTRFEANDSADLDGPAPAHDEPLARRDRCGAPRTAVLDPKTAHRGLRCTRRADTSSA